MHAYPTTEKDIIKKKLLSELVMEMRLKVTCSQTWQDRPRKVPPERLNGLGKSQSKYVLPLLKTSIAPHGPQGKTQMPCVSQALHELDSIFLSVSFQERGSHWWFAFMLLE